MLDRFTGTADRKINLISGVPMKRIDHPEEIAEAKGISPQQIDVLKDKRGEPSNVLVP